MCLIMEHSFEKKENKPRYFSSCNTCFAKSHCLGAFIRGTSDEFVIVYTHGRRLLVIDFDMEVQPLVTHDAA